MSKKVVIDHSEKLKQNIDAVTKKSKETIHGIIGSTSKQFEAALDSNKEFMDTIEKQSFNMDFADKSIIGEIKKTFGNSIELSEEAIDTIIDIHTGQLQSAIDVNLKLIETIKSRDFQDQEDVKELIEIIQRNFERTSQEAIENTKKITDIYNKHINLSLNFTERFSEKIN